MKSKRRITLLIILLLLLGTGIFIVVKYRSFARENKNKDITFILPRLEQTIVEIKSITQQQTEINARMLFNNPLPLKIAADSIAYEIFIRDSSVLKTTYRESITLKASDTSWIFIPVSIDNDRLGAILDQSEKLGFDSVYYEVRGSFYSHLLNDKKFSFHFGKRLPLFHFMNIEITRVVIDSANFNRFKLLIHANVKNKNAFELKTKDIGFRFAIAGNKWIEGMRPGAIRIPPDSTVEVIFPVTVSLEEVGETVFTLLRKGKDIGYTLEVNLKIISDKNMLNNSLIKITSQGTIEEILDLAKPRNKKSAKNK